jgi:hypothetical protein
MGCGASAANGEKSPAPKVRRDCSISLPQWNFPQLDSSVLHQVQEPSVDVGESAPLPLERVFSRTEDPPTSPAAAAPPPTGQDKTLSSSDSDDNDEEEQLKSNRKKEKKADKKVDKKAKKIGEKIAKKRKKLAKRNAELAKLEGEEHDKAEMELEILYDKIGQLQVRLEGLNQDIDAHIFRTSYPPVR